MAQTLKNIPEWVWVLGAVGIVILLASPRKTAETLASGAVGAADGVIAGTVKGFAGLFGIPDTDKTKCRQAKANGEFWKSTAYCSAGELFGGVDE